MVRERSASKLERTSKSLSESGERCLLAITSARRTSLMCVALSERTDPTIPVALGGENSRNGTLARFQTGSWCGSLRGRADAG